MDDRSILKDQVAYYRARAGEYDEWHLRQGRYYRGDEHKRQWFAELDILQSELERGEAVRQVSRACLRHGVVDSMPGRAAPPA